MVRLTGELSAKDEQTGVSRKLRIGDIVYVGEKIESTESGEAVVRTDDSGVIAIRPKSLFYLQAFQANPLLDSQFHIKIVRGTLRLITGLIGKFNKNKYQIQTPQSTIGIRGTDQEPYVLSSDMAVALKTKEGTYNKVNSGSVVLQGLGGGLVLERGQAGFVPTRPKSSIRGLITALLPVLLDRVPDFYLPGQFDEGLEQYAANQLSQGSSAQDTQVEVETSESSIEIRPNILTKPAPGYAQETLCRSDLIVNAWLNALDQSIERRDPQAFLDLFADDVYISVNSRLANGKLVETKLSRDEFMKSTYSSFEQLSAFQSKRISMASQLIDGDTCRHIKVSSTVIEQGIIAGRPYRLETDELYELRMEQGVWRASIASTTQK
jgi:hypothetical protein